MLNQKFAEIVNSGKSDNHNPKPAITRRRAPNYGTSAPDLAVHFSRHRWVSHLFWIGAQGRNRTTDTRIFSPLLYRLSYLGVDKLSGHLRKGGI